MAAIEAGKHVYWNGRSRDTAEATQMLDAAERRDHAVDCRPSVSGDQLRNDLVADGYVGRCCRGR